MTRGAGLFLFLLGGALAPIGAVLYALPLRMGGAGLYLFVIGLALLSLALLTSLPVLLPARPGRLVDLAETVLYSALTVLVLLAGYRLVAGHPIRRDLTKDQSFALTPQTKRKLAELAVPVRATAFLDRHDPRLGAVRALLAEYETASPLFAVRVLDPQERPSEVTRLGVAGMSCVVLESGTRAVRVRALQEPNLTAGLIRLVRPAVPVGFSAGHKERELKATARDQLAGVLEALELENIEPVRVTLASGVPDRVRAVVLAGPKSDLTVEELGELDRTLERGAGVMVALELATDPQPNLIAWLAKHGLACPQALVLDMDMHAKNDAGTLIVEELPAHPLTRGVSGLLLPGARPVGTSDAVPKGASVDTLLRTGERSWAEMDAGREFAFTEGRDMRGPVPLAAAVQLSKGRLLVIGNALFMSDLALAAKGNRDFLVNALAWVAEHGEMPGILPDMRAERLLVLREEDLGVMAAVTLIGMPLVTILVGTFLWLYRR